MIVAGAALVAVRPWEPEPREAFAYTPDGAAERAERAGLTAGGDPHIHPKINVVVRDAKVEVPGDMGLAGGMQPMHTHEADGTVHVEGARDGRLGHFMGLWGVEFGPDRLGPHRTRGSERVRMWVKAPKASAFKEVPPDPSLRLEDGQEVYLYYGPPAQAPIAS